MISLNYSPSKSIANDTSALKQVWESINYDSCPYNYNFHMHTIHSDGQLTPENVIDQAIAIGLKGLAITDHHSLGGFYAAWHFLNHKQQKNPDLCLPYLWTGVEINAILGDAEVHILGYSFDPHHLAIQHCLQGNSLKKVEALASSVIAALHQAGGLAVLAHPARYRQSADELIPLASDAGIDGIEVYYGYGQSNPWQPSVEICDRIKKMTDKYGLLSTCGTDTHGTNLLLRV